MNDPFTELDFSDAEITLLVSEFYSRVKTDDLLCPMYPIDDWEGAEERLRGFLIYRLGGSDRYIQQRGHPRLGMRHASFAIGEQERERWLALMKQSMEQQKWKSPKKNALERFFQQVAEFLQNR